MVYLIKKNEILYLMHQGNKVLMTQAVSRQLWSDLRILFDVDTAAVLIPQLKGDNQGEQYRERRLTRHALLRHILLVLCLYII